MGIHPGFLTLKSSLSQEILHISHHFMLYLKCTNWGRPGFDVGCETGSACRE